MRSVNLGATGVSGSAVGAARRSGAWPETTALGFGCSGIVGTNSKADSLRLLAAAVDLGIRHFDVARSYGSGDAEALLGEALKGRREPCTVATKCGINAGAAYRFAGPRSKLLVRAALRRAPGLYGAVRTRAATGVQRGQFSPEQIRSSFETSLRALGRDHVELLLLHECTAADWTAVPTQAVLAELLDAGAVGTVGTATSATVTREILGGEWPAPAVQFHDSGTAACAELVGLARDRGAVTLTHGVIDTDLRAVRSLLAGGGADAPEHWSRELDANLSDTSVVAGLLLRRALARNSRGVVLYRTNRVERLRSAVAAAEVPMEGGELAVLDSLLETAAGSPAG